MEFLTQTYRGKRVFVTGHTGFKGAWLCEWLSLLGAEVWGYSLPPPTSPSLFDQLALSGRVRHHLADVRDGPALRRAVEACRPDFVFHLAAQPLVRASYEQPVDTYATNVMGTVHLLEALRVLENPCAAVFVTTDKCYENTELGRDYREEDPLGGHDPYSSSKAAAEIAVASFRRSFFPPEKILAGATPPVAIASARAGNVIGGGDWAQDRLVPDCMRALSARQPIVVRNPDSTRPWQHVLEPLGGYLTLGAHLARALADQSPALATLCSAFNFGPSPEANRPVVEVVEEILRHWSGTWQDVSDPGALHEAKLLSLAIDKSHRVLDWTPRWNFSETVERTVSWYRQVLAGDERPAMRALTTAQIAEFAGTSRQLAAIS